MVAEWGGEGYYGRGGGGEGGGTIGETRQEEEQIGETKRERRTRRVRERRSWGGANVVDGPLRHGYALDELVLRLTSFSSKISTSTTFNASVSFGTTPNKRLCVAMIAITARITRT